MIKRMKYNKKKFNKGVFLKFKNKNPTFLLKNKAQLSRKKMNNFLIRCIIIKIYRIKIIRIEIKENKIQLCLEDFLINKIKILPKRYREKSGIKQIVILNNNNINRVEKGISCKEKNFLAVIYKIIIINKQMRMKNLTIKIIVVGKTHHFNIMRKIILIISTKSLYNS